MSSIELSSPIYIIIIEFLYSASRSSAAISPPNFQSSTAAKAFFVPEIVGSYYLFVTLEECFRFQLSFLFPLGRPIHWSFYLNNSFTRIDWLLLTNFIYYWKFIQLLIYCFLCHSKNQPLFCIFKCPLSSQINFLCLSIASE